MITVLHSYGKKIIMEIKYSDVFPIQSIEDNCLINGNGDITFGFSILLPEVFLMSEDDLYTMHSDLVKLFQRLPVGALIQKLDFYSNGTNETRYSESDPLIRRENLKMIDGRLKTKHDSYIFITLSSKKYFRISGMKNPFLSSLKYIFNKPFRDLDKYVEEIKNISTMVSNGINSIAGMKVKRLNDCELQNILYKYVSLSYDKEVKDINEFHVLPPLQVNKNSMKLGDKYVSYISLVAEGDRVDISKISKGIPASIFNNGAMTSDTIKLPTNFVYPIGIALPIDHVLSTTIEILEKDSVLFNLTMEGRQLNLLASIGYEPAITKKNMIDSYKQAISEFNYQPCRTSCSVIVSNKDESRLSELSELVKEAFNSMNGAKSWIENYDTANLFFATIPGNAKCQYRGWLNVVDSAVCYMAKETHYKSDPQGNLFIDRMGNPVYIDMWKNKLILARNGVVIAPTGGGKSVYLCGYTSECLFNKGHVVIVDIGHSYRKICTLEGGVYIDSSDKKSLSVNPFLCNIDEKGKYLWNEVDEDGEGAEDRINYIITILVEIWKGDKTISNEERQILKDMIRSFYGYINENKIFPNMIEFVKYTRLYELELKDNRKKYFDFNSFELILEDFTVGEYKDLLNSEKNIDLSKEKFIVFDLEAVQKSSKRLFNILSVIIIELVLAKTRKLRGIRKSLIIDEGLDFLKSERMGDFIAYLYRTFRKKDGQVILATQDARFFKEADTLICNSITINTSTFVLMDNPSRQLLGTREDLQKIFAFTDFDMEQFASVEITDKYRDLFLKMGNKTRIFRNELNEFTYGLYTTTELEVKEIERLFLEKGNLLTAINQFNENKLIIKNYN